LCCIAFISDLGCISHIGYWVSLRVDRLLSFSFFVLLVSLLFDSPPSSQVGNILLELWNTIDLDTLSRENTYSIGTGDFSIFGMGDNEILRVQLPGTLSRDMQGLIVIRPSLRSWSPGETPVRTLPSHRQHQRHTNISLPFPYAARRTVPLRSRCGRGRCSQTLFTQTLQTVLIRPISVMHCATKNA